ncbi:type I-E CRISPR-associated protein Cse2/CasB [Oxalobacteraceae bacterium A2-2]
MSDYVNFGKQHHFGDALVDWWEGLATDRAARASLRRCATLDQVVLDPAYQRFYRYMLQHGWPAGRRPERDDRLAAIAGLLVLVEVNVDVPTAEGMSLPASEGSDRPLVSELRFRDLLRREGVDEIFISMRRVLPLMKNKANIRQLANDIYNWDRDDRVKRHWAYTYRWPDKKTT